MLSFSFYLHIVITLTHKQSSHKEFVDRSIKDKKGKIIPVTGRGGA
jgi:hypothetical protein